MLEICCYLVFAGLASLVAAYGCVELHYFLRMLLAVVVARCFKKRRHILAETTVSGICLTTDIDTCLSHMNNARFLRELDFARVDFYERTNLYRTIRRKKATVALGATTIRYRRYIKLFTRYSIKSKIIYWDSDSIYMEYRFVTPSDNFVNAVVFCKTRIIGCNAEEVMQELLDQPPKDVENANIEKPELPLEVIKWMESNDISSARLREEAGVRVNVKI